MRRVEWLFVVSVALFISGIGFIIASGASGAARRAASPRPSDAPAPTPIASLKQIMNGIVMPNATVVYNAVGTSMTAAGVVESAPKDDKEWAAVADSAAALVESGNLLLLGDRAVDRGDWVTMTRKFIEQANLALVAAETKNTDGVFMAGGDLNTTCDVCHEKYQRR